MGLPVLLTEGKSGPNLALFHDPFLVLGISATSPPQCQRNDGNNNPTPTDLLLELVGTDVLLQCDELGLQHPRLTVGHGQPPRLPLLHRLP